MISTSSLEFFRGDHSKLYINFTLITYCTGRSCNMSIISIVDKNRSLSTKFDVNHTICNSNWTEWSTIQGVTERVFSKSDEREVRGRFEITSTITP